MENIVIEQRTQEAIKGLAAEIRSFLKEKRINEGDFADEIGVGRSTFSNWLNGITQVPGMDLLLKPILFSEFRPRIMRGDVPILEGVPPALIAEAVVHVERVASVTRPAPDAEKKGRLIADLAAQMAQEARQGGKVSGVAYLERLREEVQATSANAPSAPRKKRGRSGKGKT